MTKPTDAILKPIITPTKMFLNLTTVLGNMVNSVTDKTNAYLTNVIKIRAWYDYKQTMAVNS